MVIKKQKRFTASRSELRTRGFWSKLLGAAVVMRDFFNRDPPPLETASTRARALDVPKQKTLNFCGRPQQIITSTKHLLRRQKGMPFVVYALNQVA